MATLSSACPRLLCLLLLGAACPAGRAELLGYWNFDQLSLAETSKFQPPGTHDGRTLGVVRFSDDVPPGFTGYCAEFPGTAQPYGFIVSNTSLKNDPGYQDTFDERIKKAGQLTVALWVKAPPVPADAVDDAKSPGLVLKWGRTDGKVGGFKLCHAKWNPAVELTTAQAEDVLASQRSESGPDPFDDTWHHIAFTRDGQTRRCYVDGRLTGTIPDEMVHWATCPDVGIMIGAGSPKTSPLRGKLDDIRIYDEALDQAAIQQLMRPPAATLSTTSPAPQSSLAADGATPRR
jgi:hypothetical protein